MASDSVGPFASGWLYSACLQGPPVVTYLFKRLGWAPAVCEAPLRPSPGGPDDRQRFVCDMMRSFLSEEGRPETLWGIGRPRRLWLPQPHAAEGAASLLTSRGALSRSSSRHSGWRRKGPEELLTHLHGRFHFAELRGAATSGPPRKGGDSASDLGQSVLTDKSIFFCETRP